MKKRKLLLFAAAALSALLLTGCAGDPPAENGSDETKGEELMTYPEDPSPVETPTEANILEAWNLADGGRNDVFASAVGSAGGTVRWGAWLPTDTFGFTLDFSCEGSFGAAADTRVNELTDSFTMSAWIKTPPRDNDRRVILTGGMSDPSLERAYVDESAIFNFTFKEGWSRLANCDMKRCEDPDAVDGECIELTGSDGPLIAALQFRNTDYSETLTEDKFLHIRIWAEDASKIQTGKLEMTSSHGNGNKEAAYDITGSQLHNGWNDLYYPVTAGSCDLTNVNFLRLYLYVTGTTTLRYDTLSVCRVDEAKTGTDFTLFLEKGSGELSFEAAGLEGLASSGFAVNDGRWHHVSVTLDQGYFTYYVDAHPVKTLPVTGSLTGEGTTVILGAASDARHGLNGSLSQVRIFSGAIQPAAITNLKPTEADNTFSDPTLTLMKGIWFSGYDVGIQDIYNIRDMGFDHGRAGFDPETADLSYINNDGSLNVAAMQKFDMVISNFVRAGVPVVVGPHPTQVFKDKWITDQSRFEQVVRWYGDMAAYIADHYTPDQVAISIMSEPAGGPADVSWTWIADRLIVSMRNAAPGFTLMSGGNACGNIEYTKAMEPMTDDNLMYQISTYEPYTIGFGTGNTALSGVESFWHFIGNIPYPVPEGLTDDEIEAILDDVTANEPAKYVAEARRVIKNYLLGVSDAGDHYVNNYGGVYDRSWHERRWASVNEWAASYGGAHVHLSECGSIDSVQMSRYFGTAEGSGSTKEIHNVHLADLVGTALEAGIGYDFCCYNNAELTVFDTTLRTRPGNGLSSDLALSWYEYGVLEALQVTPVREYHPTADLQNACLALPLNDEEGTEEAASELLLGHTAAYGTVKTVADADRDRAARFEGGEDRLIAANSGTAPESGLTVSAWVKADKGDNGRRVLMTQTEDLTLSADGVAGRFNIADCEDSTGWWGISPIATKDNISPDGQLALVTTAPETVIFCYVFPGALDVSGYLDNGYVSIDVWLEDASATTAIRVELYTDDTPYHDVHWQVNGPFKDGWNTLHLPGADHVNNQADPTNCTSWRFVGYCTGTTTMAIDNFYAGLDTDSGKTFNYWTLALDDAGHLDFTSDALTGTAPSTASLPDDGAWHHVVASLDGEELTYYIDGAEAGRTAVKGLPEVPASSDTVIGADSRGANGFAGLLSGIRVYTAPKTPDETLPS